MARSISMRLTAVERSLKDSVGGLSRGQTMPEISEKSDGADGVDPAMTSLRTKRGAVKATICTAHPPIEKPNKSMRLMPGAVTKAIRSSAHPW